MNFLFDRVKPGRAARAALAHAAILVPKHVVSTREPVSTVALHPAREVSGQVAVQLVVRPFRVAVSPPTRTLIRDLGMILAAVGVE